MRGASTLLQKRQLSRTFGTLTVNTVSKAFQTIKKLVERTDNFDLLRLSEIGGPQPGYLPIALGESVGNLFPYLFGLGGTSATV